MFIWEEKLCCPPPTSPGKNLEKVWISVIWSLPLMHHPFCRLLFFFICKQKNKMRNSPGSSVLVPGSDFPGGGSGERGLLCSFCVPVSCSSVPACAFCLWYAHGGGGGGAGESQSNKTSLPIPLCLWKNLPYGRSFSPPLKKNTDLNLTGLLM